jgi:membrane protease YdiL (CAAX protease family)
MFTPANLAAALLTLLPFLYAAFFPRQLAGIAGRLPTHLQPLPPALLAIPYALVTLASHTFHGQWFLLYALLPVAIALLLQRAAVEDPTQHGTWRDFFVLASIGLAVDLRWFEPAWPPHLSLFNKILLLDAGIYAFLAIRRLEGTGFDLRIRPSDLKLGLRELALYAPVAILLGLALRFLHLNPQTHWRRAAPFALFFTFFFIAVPEELFFRGWLQNLLEKRLGRTPALFVTAILFGLAHFNKRATHFNWRYVLLAALAGIFYGRAWLGGRTNERRVAASSITHASVDTLWSLLLR